MVPEAPLEQDEAGRSPAGEGWFVLNARDARWLDFGELGLACFFEGKRARFDQLGINLNILQPGEPNCMYHGEDDQEDFLVLSGECLLIVEGEERRLGAWDFVHCPPWTEHAFVGAGDEPCLLLAVGSRTRTEGSGIRYPVNEAALRHGAGVETETSDPDEAYARFAAPRPVPCPDELPRA